MIVEVVAVSLALLTIAAMCRWVWVKDWERALRIVPSERTARHPRYGSAWAGLDEVEARRRNDAARTTDGVRADWSAEVWR